MYANGRWHRKGVLLAYAAEHPAVATLEKLTRLETYEKASKSRYVLLSLELDPDAHLEVLDVERLPDDWDAFPYTKLTQGIGMRWIQEQRSAVLEVPSAVIRIAKNYLINPLHPGFHELTIGLPQHFAWDSRLFRRG